MLRPHAQDLVATCCLALWTPLVGSITSAAAQTLTLAEATEAALASHPLVASARARVSAAREATAAARAARLPGAALNGTITRFEEPMVVAPLHSLDLRAPPRFDRTLVQAQISAQYTLFDGARSGRIRAADAALELSEISFDEQRMQVLEETAAAYLAVLAARAVHAAAAAHVAALEVEHARAEQHLAAGAVPELEVLRAAAALQDARAEEASARARADGAERDLARWMGTEVSALAGRALADVTARGSGRRGDPLQGPSLRQATGSVGAAEARLAEESGTRLPIVRAGAGLLDFGTASGGHVMEWQAGLQVSWSLFTGGARGAAVRRAAAELAAAEKTLEAARLEAARAVNQAEDALLEAEARAEALAAAVAQWEEVARIEALALQAGSGEQRDLLLAEAGLFRARAGHARARYEGILARVRLARLGGVLDQGWITDALEVRR
jgi:outer membrane protein